VLSDPGNPWTSWSFLFPCESFYFPVRSRSPSFSLSSLFSKDVFLSLRSFVASSVRTSFIFISVRLPFSVLRDVYLRKECEKFSIALPSSAIPFFPSRWDYGLLRLLFLFPYLNLPDPLTFFSPPPLCHSPPFSLPRRPTSCTSGTVP